MKQVVYTCARCGRQEAVDANQTDAVPMEWATIQYVRFHAMQEDGNELTGKTTSEIHACGDCAQSLLDYIEQQPQQEGPRDEGGAPSTMASFASDLLRINAQMFEGTIRVLSQQNQRLNDQNLYLHEQVTALAATNARLHTELEMVRSTVPAESPESP